MSGDDGTPRARAAVRGRRGALVAVVLTVVGVAVLVAVIRVGGSADAAAGSNRDRTIAVLDRLVRAVGVRPGLHRVPNGRPYGLIAPLELPTGTTLLDRRRIWVGPGDVDAARRFVAHHLPPGARASGGAGTSVGGRAVVTGDTYDLDHRWQRPDLYSWIDLQASFAQVGHQVAVRIDAVAQYLPSRTADQHVSESVTGVVITRTTDDPPSTVRRTAGARTARRLARDLNGLRPYAPGGVYHCGQWPSYTTTLRFTGAPGAPVATIHQGCGAAVSIGSGPGLNLDVRTADDLAAALR